MIDGLKVITEQGNITASFYDVVHVDMTGLARKLIEGAINAARPKPKTKTTSLEKKNGTIGRPDQQNA